MMILFDSHLLINVVDEDELSLESHFEELIYEELRTMDQVYNYNNIDWITE
jgi:hypothetical protein